MGIFSVFRLQSLNNLISLSFHPSLSLFPFIHPSLSPSVHLSLSLPSSPSLLMSLSVLFYSPFACSFYVGILFLTIPEERERERERDDFMNTLYKFTYVHELYIYIGRYTYYVYLPICIQTYRNLPIHNSCSYTR
jgi:hypothetical protein